MAKNDNLKDFLTDVADAIREKKGTEDLINPQNFSDEIRNLPSGGGEVVEVEEKDVNFYDYDGTLLFSYTIEEAQALTELPTPPTHEGLVFDGWNWDYEDVIALDYPMDIGAMYVTDDDKTRLYLEIEQEEGVDIELSISLKGDFAYVDFGDGSGEVSFGQYSGKMAHHYAKGNYVLTLRKKDGVGFTLGSADSNYNILGLKHYGYTFGLKKVEMGSNISLAKYAFAYTNIKTITFTKATKIDSYLFDTSDIQYIVCPPTTTNTWWSGGFFVSCQGVSFPNGLKSVDSPTFRGCGFPHAYLPKSVTSIGVGAFEQSLLQKIVAKGSITFGNAAFNTCTNLRIVDIELKTIPNQLIRTCFNLNAVTMAEGLTDIKDQAFWQCYRIQEFTFPKSLKSIAANAFYYCGAVKYDFTKAEEIPTLASTSAFTGTPTYCKIIVPDALYDAWKAATNWSTYADRIVKASEYNG